MNRGRASRSSMEVNGGDMSACRMIAGSGSSSRSSDERESTPGGRDKEQTRSATHTAGVSWCIDGNKQHVRRKAEAKLTLKS